MLIKLVIPDYVLKNDDIHGVCTSNVIWPRIVIHRNNECNFKRELHKQRENKLFSTNFVVRNVTATCQYRCVVPHLSKIKTVAVTGSYVYACIYVVYMHVYFTSHCYTTQRH